MDALEMALLFDSYGGLQTDKQRESYDMRYNQDLSLGEIAQELGVSRQAVCDNLTRTEALLRKMESNVGCVRRDLNNRRKLSRILELAGKLSGSSDDTVSDLARQIMAAAREIEE